MIPGTLSRSTKTAQRHPPSAACCFPLDTHYQGRRRPWAATWHPKWADNEKTLRRSLITATSNLITHLSTYLGDVFSIQNETPNPINVLFSMQFDVRTIQYTKKKEKRSILSCSEKLLAANELLEQTLAPLVRR